MHSAMQLNIYRNHLNNRINCSLARCWRSVFCGSMHLHYWNTENGRYHENFVNQIQIQK